MILYILAHVVAFVYSVNDTALKLITTPRLAELCDRSFRHSVILSASRITHERVMRSKIFIILKSSWLWCAVEGG